jgi:flagellar basal body-associated protein FliL
MMQQMGPSMMFGMTASMLFWVVLTTVVILLLIGACTWLIVNWLKNQRQTRMQAVPEPREESYAEYEQGYQPQQPAETETYQSGGQHYIYPQAQYEQPQVQQHK